MSDAITRYKEAFEAVRAARKAAEEAAKVALSEGPAAIFAKHEGLESFGWTQYRNFFNDGDACNFNVHADEPYINGDRSYDLEEGDPLRAAADEVTDFAYLFDADDLESAFGDHVKVVFNRDSTTKTNEYTRHD